MGTGVWIPEKGENGSVRRRRRAGLRLSGRAGRAALIGAWVAAAAPPAAGSDDLSIEGAWARASIGRSTVSAVYFTITNRGPRADRLVRASSGRAARTMFHRSLVEDGVAKMRHADTVDVPAGVSIRFEPGGLHVMLTGVSASLRAGEELTLTLGFERAGEMVVAIPVRTSPPPSG